MASQARATSNLINGFYWLKQVGIVARLAARAGDPAAAAKWQAAFSQGAAQFNALYLAKTTTNHAANTEANTVAAETTSHHQQANKAETKLSSSRSHGAVDLGAGAGAGGGGGYADIECSSPLDRQKQPCHETSVDGVLSVQTLQALPLALGLPPTPADAAAVGAALAAAVENGTYPGRTDTGLVGTK
jgi:hypothetical protein